MAENQVVYENPTPVAVGIVPVRMNDGTLGVLGVIRNIGKIGDALPGGFVDKLESIETATARELREETGLETAPGDWRLTSSGISPRNHVLVFSTLTYEITEADVETLVFDPVEVSGLKIFTLQSELVFPLHQEAMRNFFIRQLERDMIRRQLALVKEQIEAFA